MNDRRLITSMRAPVLKHLTEDAWRELFGPYLSDRVCVLVVKSRIDVYSDRRIYRREYLAYVL